MKLSHEGQTMLFLCAIGDACLRVCKCYLEMSGSLHLAYLDTTCLWHSNDDRLARLKVRAAPAPMSYRGVGGGVFGVRAYVRSCNLTAQRGEGEGKKKGQSKV